MPGTAATAGAPVPLYSRDELLRLCALPDETVGAWAAERLAGDGALIAVLAGRARGAAHVAFHALGTDCWAPEPEAVAAAWGRVAEDWRPVLADLAARAGWVGAAQDWAGRVHTVPAGRWSAVASYLRPLQPELLAAAAAEAWAGRGPGAEGAGTLLGVAACSTVGLPIAVAEAWHGGSTALEALGDGLLVRGTAQLLAEALQAPSGHWATGPGGGAPLPRVLRGWSAAAPPPWELLQAAAPPRDRAACRSAIRRLQAALPPAAAVLGPTASAVDAARRRCLQALGDPDLRSAPRVREGSEVSAGELWAFGVSLYAAIAHPVDWWGALAGPAEMTGGPAAGRDPAERALDLLSCLHGDPPPWYPRLAARCGPGLVQAFLRLGPGEDPAAGGSELPTVPPPRLRSLGARAAAAVLARTGALLADGDAERLRAAVLAAPPGIVLTDLAALGRFLPPSAAARLGRVLQGAPPVAASIASSATHLPAAADANWSIVCERRLALRLLGAMPWAEAAAELAAALPSLILDPYFWPQAAEVAAGTGSPVVLQALLVLWRPGDEEIGSDLLWLAALGGAPRGGGLDAVRRDLAPHGGARHDHDHARAPWPLRCPLQCAVCGRLHVYDVRQINMCWAPVPVRRGGGRQPAGLPPTMRWGRTGTTPGSRAVDLVLDTLTAPRFVCRSCGAGGRSRVGVAGTQGIANEIEAWERRHGEFGCPEGTTHGARRRPAGRDSAEEPPADWHDRVRFVDPLVTGSGAVSVKDALEHAEALAADGRAALADLLFLAEQWIEMGDLPAAVGFAARAREGQGMTAGLSLVQAELEEAAGHPAAALPHWRSALALASRAGGDPDVAAAARQALQRLGDGRQAAPDPAAPPAAGRRPAVRAPAVGRNDPCPCGSGKKYKRCHGA